MLLIIGLYAGGGFLVGAFTPGILRKIKAYFVKETSAAKSAVTGAVKTAATDVAKKV
jgi:hypothetical protein